MATVMQYRAYEEVLARVNDVRMRLVVRRTLDAALGAAAIAGATLLVVAAAQSLGRFDAVGREVLRVILAVGVLTAVARAALLLFTRAWTDERVARFIETQVPDVGNSLINVIQLVRDSSRWSPVLLDRAMGEAAAATRSLDLARSVSWRRVVMLAIAAAVVVAAIASFVLLAPGDFASAVEQILHPWSFVPTRGSLKLEVRPGDVTLTRGEPLRVEVRFSGPAALRREARLYVVADGETGEHAFPMTPIDGSPTAFSYDRPEVSAPLRYRVEVGSDQTDFFTVSIREKPVVTQLTVGLTFPDYTGRRPTIERNASGNVRAPIGTELALVVGTSSPVDGATVRFADGRTLSLRSASTERTEWRSAWRIFADDTYTVETLLAGRPADAEPIEYHIEAVADQAPVVSIPLPGREVSVPPGGKLRVLVKATDDYGFRQVQLFAQPASAGQGGVPSSPLRQWSGRDIAGRTSLALDHEIAIPAEAKLGSVYEYWAEASDNLVYQGESSPREPHVVRSDRARIVVQDTAAVAQAQLKEAADLYDRLQRLLDQQKEARGWVGSLAGLDASAVVSRLRDVAFRQKEIRKGAVETVQQVVFDRETASVKATLELLIQNQMREAERQSDALVDVASAGRADRTAQHGLASVQNEIIVALERLLEIAQARIRVAESALGKAGVDLPPDVAARMKSLAEKLKSFVEEQKKVIEESEKLAKKPVDDFTQEDKQKLAELAVTEDKWEKFLADAVSEMSNLPQLDASNPTLLKELIEAKVDVEMAADALRKDAVEIAVALEEAGAELAEEIVENLERWLPDTPDRIKWSMEEPLAPMEIPNAELPEQLEDLVGDLLEQEEDVFDEMEDATSGWADSLDKGAGWDAMDGPISNYSAKGVTGNQLPNSSEIGGRSGEGRTGRSSGEFVEDTATGKGGRRTPTRVTNDPFTQGDVKDTSNDPPGGATGGGKVSGAGQEGLEGPVPRDTERRMQRLAGRQAQVRSKAERINVELKVRNYESFNLDEALLAMRRVERELLAGRYQNAMREKHLLLNELKGTKMLLGGEVRVRSDRRSDLPDEYRKEIEEASKAPMPEGYEALLNAYYERLSRGD